MFASSVLTSFSDAPQSCSACTRLAARGRG